MKKTYPVEFVFQTVSLIVAIIMVHAIYVLVVRPRADYILAEQQALMEADENYVQERSVYVIIRDFEQETCFILMLWAMSIMSYKAMEAAREKRLLETDLVPVAEGTKILPEDAREYARQIQSLPDSEQRLLLPRALLSALGRFGATRNIQGRLHGPPTLSPRRSRNDWTPSSRWSATSRGPSLRSDSSGPFAVSVRPSARRTRRLKETSRVSLKAWALLSIPPSSRS